MTAVFTIEGHPLKALRVIVANIGPWVAECDMQDDIAVSGVVRIQAGQLTLVGTVQLDGTYALQRRVRVVAGAAGWSNELRARSYHNDAGVKCQAIAADAARECGERLGVFVPQAERLGRDYVRTTGQAARALEAACGPGVAWWVDTAGVTHAGPRPAVQLAPERYTVLAYDPRSRLATLATEDPADVVIGAQLTALGVTGTVREYQLEIAPAQVRVVAWLSEAANEPGRLAGLVRSVVARATDARVHGMYRYRVVSVAGDSRLNLQAVRAVAGLPDVATVSQWPGVAGAKCTPALSSECLVSFVEGDPAQPVVLAFTGPDGQGFAPQAISLGDQSGPPAARVGDAVEVLLPPAVFNGTLGVPPAGTPITGVITFPSAKAEGAITGGSAKVQIA